MAVVVVDRETQIDQALGKEIEPTRIDDKEPARDHRGKFVSKTEDDAPAQAGEKNEGKTSSQKIPNETDIPDKEYDLLTDQQKRTVNKKHWQMKEADEFAESQYRERKAAEKRAEEYERELKDLREKGKPEPAQDKSKEPDPKDFTNEKGEFDAFGYAKALAKHAAEEAVKADRKEQEKANREAAEARSYQEYVGRVQASAKGIEDWNEICENAADMQVSGALTGYIRESESPAPLLAHLARNPDELERLNALPTIKAIREIAKLELTLSAKETEIEKPVPKATTKPRAPEPVAPLSNGAGHVKKDLKDMTTRDHIDDEYRQAREAHHTRKRH